MKTSQLLGGGPCHSCNDAKRPDISFISATASIDLTKVAARVAEQHPDWSFERLNTAVLSYRRFFADAKHNAGGRFPGEDADEVWHAHILHTDDYMRDCDEHIGFYLHHVPKPNKASGQPCSSGDRCGDVQRRH